MFVYYFIPCIIFTSFLLNNNSSKAALKGIAAIMMKKVDKEYIAEILSI